MPLILGRSGNDYVAMVTKLLSLFCGAHLVESYFKEWNVSDTNWLTSFFIIFDQNLVEHGMIIITEFNGICSGISTKWLFIHCSEIELESKSFDFCGGRKTGKPGEKPSEQGQKQQQTQPTCGTWSASNLGHLGGKRAATPLHLPFSCSSNVCFPISKAPMIISSLHIISAVYTFLKNVFIYLHKWNWIHSSLQEHLGRLFRIRPWQK